MRGLTSRKSAKANGVGCAPAIAVPVANYDNNQRAEDENLRLQNLWDGIEIVATIMTMK
jgi:hypothetical protein